MGYKRRQLPLPGLGQPSLGPVVTNLKGLNVRELDQQLAIASRTKSAGLKSKVLAEYKRRGIKPPTK